MAKIIIIKNKVNRWILDEMIKNNDNISNVDTSLIDDMSGLFYECKDFNQDISSWDTSNVTDMSDMFYGCHTFNQDISSWDISNVKDTLDMFNGCNIKPLFLANNKKDTLYTKEAKIEKY